MIIRMTLYDDKKGKGRKTKGEKTIFRPLPCAFRLYFLTAE